ncbi:nuclear transcription factor Y subunit B-8-like [Bidens hawaiensis]|uniref:nuclear transcription factor Y subunit B-8-like n=1 Tax=Bidens hawaiensis TaxID=980011 RepID=UPI004049548C
MANDKCQKEQSRIINSDDLLWAMATLGFEDYVEPLKAFLKKYREVTPRDNGYARKEVMLPDNNHNLLATQGVHSKGLNHGNSQQQAQQLVVPMHGSE